MAHALLHRVYAVSALKILLLAPLAGLVTFYVNGQNIWALVIGAVGFGC